SGIDHVEIRLDGGSAQTLSSGATSYTLNGLSDGTHTVNVTVVDKAGHSSSNSVSFRVDTSFVSPSGPYGIVGLTSIIVLVVVARGTMPHGGKYVHLVTPGTRMRLELNWYPKGSRFYVPYRKGEELDHLAFVVDDVKAAFKAVTRAGAKVAVDPDHSEGTEVYVKDPDGVWIELLA